MKSIFIKFIYEGEVDVAELIVPRNIDLQKVVYVDIDATIEL